MRRGEPETSPGLHHHLSAGVPPAVGGGPRRDPPARGGDAGGGRGGVEGRASRLIPAAVGTASDGSCMAMVVSVLTVDFRLPEASTLKEKRSVIQSMLTRARARFGVSAAEVGWQDDAGRARLALALVSTSGEHADRMLQAALGFMEGQYPVELVSAGVEHR